MRARCRAIAPAFKERLLAMTRMSSSAKAALRSTILWKLDAVYVLMDLNSTQS